MKLCNSCIKRYKIKLAKIEDEKNCYLCKGIFLGLDKIAEDVMRKFESLNVEFHTFLIGTKISKEIEVREEEVWEEDGIGGECLKTELNREIGKLIEKKYGKYRFDPDPEVKAIYDTNTGKIEIEISPVYVFGKYKKLKRTIRQTKKRESEEESVEELMEGPFLEESSGEKIVLHGSGREDINVLMLGKGRPFIVEIVEPKKRKINLRKIQNKVNKIAKGKIEISKLRFTKKESIEVIKRARFDKTYLAIVETEKRVIKEDLKKLNPCTIFQQTPTRALQRRADITRKRKIKEIRAKSVDNRHLELKITAESGTYIKEFITSDNGRTNPSISSMLGMAVECKELNVLAVHSEWYEDWW